MEDKIITIQIEDAGKRLDVLLSQKLGFSREAIQEKISAGLIEVNDKKTKSSYRVKEDDLIKFKNTDLVKVKIDNSLEMDIPIVEENKDFLIVNKPAGILTHPTEAGEKYTLSSILMNKYPELKNVGESKDRPGIVHRLDKEASGLLVIARNQKMFVHLKKLFQDREIKKEYFVLVYNVVASDHGFLDFTIDRGNDGRMAARPKIKELSLKALDTAQDGKEALTEYEVVKRFSRFTLLKVRIHTGRTHQIRVHMLAFNHPVAGDSLYYNRKLIKKKDQILPRLFLHSYHLNFQDLEGKEQDFQIELPQELENFLNTLT